MLKDKSHTQNFVATSYIEDKRVMFMGANVKDNKSVNFSQNIDNYILYESNKEEVDNDFDVFKQEVFKSLSSN